MPGIRISKPDMPDRNGWLTTDADVDPPENRIFRYRFLTVYRRSNAIKITHKHYLAREKSNHTHPTRSDASRLRSRNRDLRRFSRISVFNRFSNNSRAALESYVRHPDRHYTRNRTKKTAIPDSQHPQMCSESTRFRRQNQCTDTVSQQRIGPSAQTTPRHSHDHTKRRNRASCAK